MQLGNVKTGERPPATGEASVKSAASAVKTSAAVASASLRKHRLRQQADRRQRNNCQQTSYVSGFSNDNYPWHGPTHLDYAFSHSVLAILRLLNPFGRKTLAIGRCYVQATNQFLERVSR